MVKTRPPTKCPALSQNFLAFGRLVTHAISAHCGRGRAGVSRGRAARVGLDVRRVWAVLRNGAHPADEEPFGEGVICEAAGVYGCGRGESVRGQEVSKRRRATHRKLARKSTRRA